MSCLDCLRGAYKAAVDWFGAEDVRARPLSGFADLSDGSDSVHITPAVRSIENIGSSGAGRIRSCRSSQFTNSGLESQSERRTVVAAATVIHSRRYHPLGVVQFYSDIENRETAYLGNFHLCPVRVWIKGKEYSFKCSEAAFQAMKFQINPKIIKMFKNDNGNQAIERARSLSKRIISRDWRANGLNVVAMREVLLAKFTQNPALRAKLLATGNAKLVEHIPIKDRDKFWGDDNDGTGRNMLGQLLMELRKKLRQRESAGSYRDLVGGGGGVRRRTSRATSATASRAAGASHALSGNSADILQARKQSIGTGLLSLGDLLKHQENKNYQAIHMGHFDWWMFPIERSSKTYGVRYTVNSQVVAALLANPGFGDQYRKGVHIMLEAWGWNTKNNKMYSRLYRGQGWDGHVVRLGKVLSSLKLFGQMDLFKQAQNFAREMIKQGKLNLSRYGWINHLVYERV